MLLMQQAMHSSTPAPQSSLVQRAAPQVPRASQQSQLAPSDPHAQWYNKHFSGGGVRAPTRDVGGPALLQNNPLDSYMPSSVRCPTFCPCTLFALSCFVFELKRERCLI